MYTDEFGLRELPFDLRPDPRFLYLSDGHKEALARLKYGLIEKKDFVVITGEVGTGKTTIINAFLEELHPGIKRVHLTDPGSTAEDLYYLIRRSLDLPIPAWNFSKGEVLWALSDYMKTNLATDERVLLIIDEAQRLPSDMLEEIRLLSNIQTSDRRLFQIFLVGQEELNWKLQAPKLTQLRQRIGVKYDLKTLSPEDTRRYILHRLRVAGHRDRPSRGQQLFDQGAVKAIYKFSKGTPRVINTLCDTALVTAYGRDQTIITRKIIKEIVRDMKASYGTRRRGVRFRLAWVAGTIIFLAVLIMAAVFYGAYNDHRKIQEELQSHAELPRSGEVKPETGGDKSLRVLASIRNSAAGKGPQAHTSTLESSLEKVRRPVHQETGSAALTHTRSSEVSRPLIEHSVISPRIENHEPVASLEQVSLLQRHVYCWLHVVDGAGQKITIRWISKGDPIAEIILPIGSNSWRTWASLTLTPDMIGPGQAEILSEHGQLLKTLFFEVTKPTASTAPR